MNGTRAPAALPGMTHDDYKKKPRELGLHYQIITYAGLSRHAPKQKVFTENRFSRRFPHCCLHSCGCSLASAAPPVRGMRFASPSSSPESSSSSCSTQQHT